jgi:hypothetical protein
LSTPGPKRCCTAEATRHGRSFEDTRLTALAPRADTACIHATSDPVKRRQVLNFDDAAIFGVLR